MILQPGQAWPEMPKFPLPSDVAQLPTVQAVPWIEIDDDPVRFGLEGPVFDNEGNFYVCHGGPASPVTRIFKVTPEKEKSVFWQSDTIKPTGLALHKDGRFFAACLSGEIAILSPEGETLRLLYPQLDGQKLRPNDLVFSRSGDVYFTDWRGCVGNELAVYSAMRPLTTIRP